MNRVKRSRESLKYTFDHRHVPVLEVELGESFTVETEGAASGSYRRPEDAARLLDAWYLNYSPSMANPVTGPIYVRVWNSILRARPTGGRGTARWGIRCAGATWGSQRW